MADKGMSSSIIPGSLRKLKEPGYLLKALRELSAWKTVVSAHLGDERRARWKSERLARNAKESRREWETIPAEVRDAFREIPIGKWFHAVSFEEIKNMSAQEARELADRLRASE